MNEHQNVPGRVSNRNPRHVRFENTNFNLQTSGSLFYTPNESEGTINILPSAVKQHQETTSNNATFQTNNLQKLQKRNVNAMPETCTATISNPVYGLPQEEHRNQPSRPVLPQKPPKYRSATTSSPVHPLSVGKLIEEAEHSRLIVPDTPGSRCVGFKSASSSNQQSMSTSESFQNSGYSCPQSDSSIKKNLESADKQTPSAITKLRQQFEQIISEQLISVKPSGMRPTRNRLDVAQGMSELNLNLDAHQMVKNQQDWGTLPNQRWRGLTNKELQPNIENPSASNITEAHNLQAFNSFSDKQVVEDDEFDNEFDSELYDDFDDEVEEEEAMEQTMPYESIYENIELGAQETYTYQVRDDQEAWGTLPNQRRIGLDIGVRATNPFTNTQVKDSDNYRDVTDNALPKQPFSYTHESNSQTNSTRNRLLIPRQRASYAEEPRPRPKLKPSTSFYPADHKIKPMNRSEDDAKLENIVKELIKSEEDYVQNLQWVVQNYGSMCTRTDIPQGLSIHNGYLFWNFEQIAIFHQDTLLPMLQRNRNDVKKLFDEFSILLDENCLYGYVIYTMNKRKSLEICQSFAPYLLRLQKEFDDKLGLESFLLQPIQRLPRYELLFKSMLTPLFAICNRSNNSYSKEHITSCCHLQNKMSALLKTINEADQIHDIIGCSKLQVYNPDNKFRKAFEIYIYDHDRNRGYNSKVFIFDKFMIYTEIVDKELFFCGCYEASKKIDIITTTNCFTMAYRRKQICEFRGESTRIEECLSAIEDMIDFNSNLGSNVITGGVDSGLGNEVYLN